MNNQIIIGALSGALGGLLIGLLITLLFRDSKKHKAKTQKTEGIMSDQIENNAQAKKPLIDRWSVRLALVGMALGIFATLSQGSTGIGFMIGFGLPLALILGSVGLIIDFIKNKKK